MKFYSPKKRLVIGANSKPPRLALVWIKGSKTMHTPINGEKGQKMARKYNNLQEIWASPEKKIVYLEGLKAQKGHLENGFGKELRKLKAEQRKATTKAEAEKAENEKAVEAEKKNIIAILQQDRIIPTPAEEVAEAQVEAPAATEKAAAMDEQKVAKKAVKKAAEMAETAKNKLKRINNVNTAAVTEAANFLNFNIKIILEAEGITTNIAKNEAIRGAAKKVASLKAKRTKLLNSAKITLQEIDAANTVIKEAAASGLYEAKAVLEHKRIIKAQFAITKLEGELKKYAFTENSIIINWEKEYESQRRALCNGKLGTAERATLLKSSEELKTSIEAGKEANGTYNSLASAIARHKDVIAQAEEAFAEASKPENSYEELKKRLEKEAAEIAAAAAKAELALAAAEKKLAAATAAAEAEREIIVSRKAAEKAYRQRKLEEAKPHQEALKEAEAKLARANQVLTSFKVESLKLQQTFLNEHPWEAIAVPNNNSYEFGEKLEQQAKSEKDEDEKAELLYRANCYKYGAIPYIMAKTGYDLERVLYALDQVIWKVNPVAFGETLKNGGFSFGGTTWEGASKKQNQPVLVIPRALFVERVSIWLTRQQECEEYILSTLTSLGCEKEYVHLKEEVRKYSDKEYQRLHTSFGEKWLAASRTYGYESPEARAIAKEANKAIAEIDVTKQDVYREYVAARAKACEVDITTKQAQERYWAVCWQKEESAKYIIGQFLEEQGCLGGGQGGREKAETIRFLMPNEVLGILKRGSNQTVVDLEWRRKVEEAIRQMPNEADRDEWLAELGAEEEERTYDGTDFLGTQFQEALDSPLSILRYHLGGYVMGAGLAPTREDVACMFSDGDEGTETVNKAALLETLGHILENQDGQYNYPSKDYGPSAKWALVRLLTIKETDPLTISKQEIREVFSWMEEKAYSRLEEKAEKVIICFLRNEVTDSSLDGFGALALNSWGSGVELEGLNFSTMLGAAACLALEKKIKAYGPQYPEAINAFVTCLRGDKLNGFNLGATIQYLPSEVRKDLMEGVKFSDLSYSWIPQEAKEKVLALRMAKDDIFSLVLAKTKPLAIHLQDKGWEDCLLKAREEAATPEKVRAAALGMLAGTYEDTGISQYLLEKYGTAADVEANIAYDEIAFPAKLAAAQVIFANCLKLADNLVNVCYGGEEAASLFNGCIEHEVDAALTAQADEAAGRTAEQRQQSEELYKAQEAAYAEAAAELRADGVVFFE